MTCREKVPKISQTPKLSVGGSTDDMGSAASSGPSLVTTRPMRIASKTPSPNAGVEKSDFTWGARNTLLVMAGQ